VYPGTNIDLKPTLERTSNVVELSANASEQAYGASHDATDAAASDVKMKKSSSGLFRLGKKKNKSGASLNGGGDDQHGDVTPTSNSADGHDSHVVASNSGSVDGDMVMDKKKPKLGLIGLGRKKKSSSYLHADGTTANGDFDATNDVPADG
jgi:hypothetical protein